MRIVACSSEDPDCSSHGRFKLVPDAGWAIDSEFIDAMSGLLIVKAAHPDQKVQRNGMATWRPTTYVFDVDAHRELGPEEWSSRFDYGEQVERSSDARFELVSRRVLGARGEGDWVEWNITEIATGEVVAGRGRSVAFDSRERVSPLQRFLAFRSVKAEARTRRDDEVASGNAQRCPHCGAAVRRNVRYPDYICRKCARLEKRDESGRKVTFTNASISGGLCVHYWGGDEIQRTDCSMPEFVCIIDGRRYFAREAHLGGVVISPEASQSGPVANGS